MQGPQIFPKKRGPDRSLDQAVWRKRLSSGGTCLLSTGAVCQDKNLTEKPTVRILTGSTCHPFASKANERRIVHDACSETPPRNAQLNSC
jgi:hypothetical protein